MSDQWVTDEEEEQISKEFRYLNKVDMGTKKWRDQIWTEFSPNVLDKYKNNSRCEIGRNYISFLAPRKDEDLTVNFEVIDGRLLVQSKSFVLYLLERENTGKIISYPERKTILNDIKSVVNCIGSPNHIFPKKQFG